jgi:adenine-specific DNA-methyltransferase
VTSIDATLPLFDAPVERTTVDSATARYIGSKARVVDEIMAIVGPPAAEESRFVDAFAGTGVVAGRAADLGWPVIVNDHLLSAVCMSAARLVAADDVPFARLGGYASAIDSLNDAPPEDGFFWSQYSPASHVGRMYFTEANARKIDAIRRAIRRWDDAGWISRNERFLLVADLISACARVANIAGTYGCFLARWSGNATRPLRLETRSLRGAQLSWDASCGDVTGIAAAADDVVYLDPPYTKRQYAAYYHVNETLAYGDEPDLIGRTGLRPWRDLASDYCYKLRALGALTRLVEGLDARRVFLSYSSEGHVALDELASALESTGTLEVHELASVGRYRPNATASAGGGDVVEVLISIEKPRR